MNGEERYALKLKIAQLYYKEKKTQVEITQLLNISRPTLIKLLKEAHDEGIVHIEIRDVHKMTEFQVLENQLKNILGLKEVKVVSASADTSDAITAGIGKEAAPFILKYFESGMTIGIGWGKTMEELSRSMAVDKRSLRDITLIPVMGGPGSNTESYTMFSNMVCEVIASKVNGRVDYVYAPLFVNNSLVYNAYMSMPNIISALKEFNRLDIALVGIDGDAEHSTTFAVEQDMKSLVAPEELQKVAGNVCSHFYDIAGNMLFAELDKKMISISTKQMRKIPTVIGLAGGEYKVKSIIGGARAKLFNVLVTDNYTAKKITMVYN